MKINSNQKLFMELKLILTDEIFEEFEKYINFEKLQSENKECILNEFGKILLKYNISNNILELSDYERILINAEIEQKINDAFIEEFKSESKMLEKNLREVINEQVNANNFIFGIDYDLKPVHENVLKKIINLKIDGKNYSDRLWENKEDVAKRLKLEVDNFLNGKTSVNDIYDIVNDKFSINDYNSKRLVNTEISRVQESANEIWRKNHDIKYVMYCATLDNKICKKCGQYDGKVYEINKTPVNLPQHSFCRCTYLDLVSPDWKPKFRIDNETKQTITYKTYKEWKSTLASH